MKFRFENKEYAAATALEIVRRMAAETHDFPLRASGDIREFLRWSLENLSGSLPPRELVLSPRMSDDALAYNYLSMCDEYGIGELFK